MLDWVNASRWSTWSSSFQLRLDLKASLQWLLVRSSLVKMESSRQRRRLRHFQLRLIAVGLLQTAANTLMILFGAPLPLLGVAFLVPNHICNARSGGGLHTQDGHLHSSSSFEARVEIDCRSSNFTPTSSPMCTGENKTVLWELFPLDGPWSELTASAPSCEMVEGVIWCI